jgi:hypothetical protein
VQLCASVGGLVATAHIVSNLLKLLVNAVCCPSHVPPEMGSSTPATTADLSATNPLVEGAATLPAKLAKLSPVRSVAAKTS